MPAASHRSAMPAALRRAKLCPMPLRPRNEPPVPAAALAAALDALAQPLLLLDRDGRLLHANTAAHECLATGKLLRYDMQGRPQPARAAWRAGFARALAAAADGVPGCLEPPRCGPAASLRPLGAGHVLLALAPARPPPAVPEGE